MATEVGSVSCAACAEPATVYTKAGKLAGFLYTKGCKCGYQDRQSVDFQRDVYERTSWIGSQPAAPPSVRKADAGSQNLTSNAPKEVKPDPEWFDPDLPEEPDPPQKTPRPGRTGGGGGKVAAGILGFAGIAGAVWLVLRG